MKIEHCRINHRENPIGCHFGSFRFSWHVEEADGPLLSRIVVHKGQVVCCDTDWKQLDMTGTVLPLQAEPRTRYIWTLYVRDEAGNTESREQFFETGKMNEPWSAQWITCTKQTDRHPIFRRQIVRRAEVVSARLYICGLGLYEAYYDGEKIGDQYLTPYCNDYSTWLQAQTYDVTDMLQKDGMLEVELGNGWYLGRFGFNAISSFRYGTGHRLIAEVHIAYADGSTEVIGTDPSWTVKRSHITFSNIYDGEHRDDTLPDMAEESCELVLDMPAPEDSRSLPVKAHEVFIPAIVHTPAGETVFDLGQNIAGIFTLRVHEPRGTVIRLQAGETLQEGNFYRENLRTAKAEYVYVSDGEEHILRPKFTFYGYRYMKVEGISDVRTEDFRGIALYSDFEKTLELHTGNAKINRLIENSRWGMQGNFLDVPTDCPQRDERMGWTGDAQVFAPTAAYFADVYPFFVKYLYDMAKEQGKRNGSVPFVVPAFDIDASGPFGTTSSVWGDATVLIPWYMYRTFGDTSILKEHYPAMKAWVDAVRRMDGEDHGWRRNFHFGDWLALDGADRPDSVAGGTDEGFIADIYYRKSAEIVSRTAHLLGYAQDEETYASLAEQIKKGIEEEYYTPSGRCAIMTQTGAVLSIMHGLGDTRKNGEMLVTLLENNNRKLKTGFVGAPFLCAALTAIGNDDLAYDLLLNEEYPGWLYEVNLGATTIWERWNSLGPDGRISSTGMNSLNHYSYGSIVQWIVERCAGLSPKEAGLRQAWIRPLPHKALNDLSLSYRSAAGMWHVSWKLLEGRKIALDLCVPYGAEADVVLPCWDGTAEADNPLFADCRDGICHVQAGSYHVEYTWTSMPGFLSLDTPIGKLTSRKDAMKALMENIPGLNPIALSKTSYMTFRQYAERNGIPEDTLHRADEVLQNLS